MGSTGGTRERVDSLPQARRLRDRQYGDAVVDRVGVPGGADDEQMVEGQRMGDVACRFRHGRGLAELHLESDAPASLDDQEIQTAAAVGAPEPGFGGAHDPQDLLDGETFPGGAHARMGKQRRIVGEAEQRMEQARVAEWGP